jgi:uncharacterized protein (TIGR03437 family)
MRLVCFLLVVSVICAAGLQAQPAVTTSPEAGLTSYFAHLAGSVNPGGLDTQVWFLWSTYSNMTGSVSTLTQDIGSGTTVANFQEEISGLSGNTKYYYQAVASNSLGTGKGAIMSFTTPTAPLVSIAITNSSNFAQGQTGATYTLTVSNAASAGPTSGTVVVTNTLPSSGVTMVSMSGSYWSCQQNTCQRNDLLGPGASYPPVTVVVNIASNAPAQVTDTASVTGPGLYPANASDLTNINPLTGEQQFINSVNTVIGVEGAALSPTVHPLVFSGNLLAANGATITSSRQDVLLDYVDGLKAAGVQRVDLNPGVGSINDPNATALYDAVVQHIRQLGLQLALNPEVNTGDLGNSPTFQDFQTAAVAAYPQLAARYQPDDFVIVHLPTTMAARLGVETQPSDWAGLIEAVAPLIQTASPRTRLGAGDFYNETENTFFEAFLAIPNLDFMTMEIFDDANFAAYTQWAEEAHAAADPTHPNGKGVYIDETWAPYYLPSPLPTNWQVETLDTLSLVGPCDADFAAMDTSWLQVISQFASANGMEAVSAYTTEDFFQYGTANADKVSEPAYSGEAQQAILNGQITGTGQAYAAESKKWGVPQAVSLSSASYATLPTVFNPKCGTGSNPCNANATVAPDELISAFGADLANASASSTSSPFPTKLAGTTMTLTDSSNTSYNVGMYFASSGQVNYLVPTNVLAGPAAITITSGAGVVTGGILLVSPVSPGIYTANQDGSGPPAAIAICAGVCSGWPNSQGNGQFYQYTFASGCTPGSCTAQTLSLGASSDQVVIELYGTGIRHISSLSALTATVNGQSVPVIYAGAQGQYPGLDQVNVMLPHSLAGSGQVSLVLTANDTVNNVNATSNAVTLNIM